MSILLDTLHVQVILEKIFSANLLTDGKHAAFSTNHLTARGDTITKHESMGKITFDSDSSSASSSPAPGEDKHQPSVSASVTLAQLHPGQRHQASHKTATTYMYVSDVIRYTNI